PRMSAKPYIATHVPPNDVKSLRLQPYVSEKLFGAMPRYFFHVRRGQVTVLDQDGTELPSLEHAAKEAIRRARELAARASVQDTAPSRRMIIIADSEWRTMVEVPF